MAGDRSTLFRGGGIHRLRRIFPNDSTASTERALWDSVAQEPARLSGTRVRLYSLRRAKNRHPLYGEPTDGAWSFQGPWEVWCTVEYQQGDEINLSSASEGNSKEVSGIIMWVARKEFEDADAPDPKLGDVVDFWEMKPYAKVSSFQYWDVIRANPDQNMFSSEIFLMWKIYLKARTEFDAERKVTP